MNLSQENIRLIFGLKVKQLRVQRGLSLAQLSSITGISPSYLNEIEKGKKYPKSDKVIILAKELDVSYDWLVSLKVNKQLAPFVNLLDSNILNELPLEMFGIEPADLVEFFANVPTKLGAFINTFIEISRNYDVSVEYFHYAVLRTFQEMQENYFPEIEKQTVDFAQKYDLFGKDLVGGNELERILVEEYKYSIQDEGFDDKAELKDLRSVFLPNHPPRLILDRDLKPNQKTFVLGRELGYNFLTLNNRAHSSSQVEIKSFEQVLNHFKASYFSSALLIPAQPFVADLKDFFNRKDWSGDAFMAIVDKYQATPEMFLQRLTNIAPKFFGMNQLFFLRFSHRDETEIFHLTKELHLSGLHSPHATVRNEHYCRRWLSLAIFKDLDELKRDGLHQNPICRAQISDYIDSPNKYLLFTIAKPKSPDSDLNSSVCVGFKFDENLKKKIHFWNDENIPIRMVNVTCERCSALDCSERASKPRIFEKQQRLKSIRSSLDNLMKS